VATFVPGAGLDARIAAVAARHVRGLVTDTAGLTRVYAPPAKVWVTAHDERVRPSHARADAQTIPGNLRYVLASADNRPGTELAVAPRDPDLRISNRINCRCISVELPGVVGAAVTSSTAVAGTRVTGRVEVRFNRVVESEFPSSPDHGGGWMRKALRDARRAGR
jgi:hypothetical protein